jgi:hypothetical protein
MSRSGFPESNADRIAVTSTLSTIVALVWLITAVPQEPGWAAFAAEAPASARHVDERIQPAAPALANYLPVPLRAAERVPAEPKRARS